MDEIEELQKQIEALTEKNEKLLEESTRNRKAKQEAKKIAEQFEGLDIEKIKADQKKLNDLEQERLKQEGKFEEALKAGLAENIKEVEALKKLIGEKDNLLSKTLIDNAVVMAIDGKAINNEQVLALMRNNIKYEDNQAVVMNGDAPYLNDKGEKISVSEYAKLFLAENQHLAMPSGGGAGSGGNIGGQGKTSISRAEFDQMPMDQKKEYVKNNGVITD